MQPGTSGPCVASISESYIIIGLIVSIFQAATQINETTLSFIPKLVGIFVALVVAGPWMLSVMLDYMREMLTGIPGMVG